MFKRAMAGELFAGGPNSQFRRDQEQSRSLTSLVKTFRNRLGARLNQIGLRDRDFSILSNDCWAEALYEDWEVPCRTPFRGLGMDPSSFLHFVSDLERYLKEPLRFVPHSRHTVVNRFRGQDGWPIGMLGEEVEIYFLHYREEEEARRAWEDGCRAINLEHVAVKFTVDKDGARPEHIEQFNRLPFKRKLLLCKRSYPAVPCAVRASKFVGDGAMMFRRSLRDFDCAHWLNTGEIRRHTPRVLLNKLIYFVGV
jgi:uncharacterized protein (DUF1919 family)